MNEPKQEIQGRIILIQEERFRLKDDTGKGFLFTLSRKAPVSVDTLERWHQENTPVLVEFEGEPNFDSGIARSVKPAREDTA